MLILYATQTGTAQYVAERIAKDAYRKAVDFRIRGMDEIDYLDLPNEKVIIFVCSTTGDGEAPEQMVNLWKFLLKRSLPGDFLADVSCSVFGLGDSSYAKFNYPAKKLWKRLIQLGAKMIGDRGDGDDQHPLGVDGAFLPWIKSVWEGLRNVLQCDVDKQEITSLPSKYKFIEKEEYNTDILKDNSAFVVKNERITTFDHFQDIRLITLDGVFDYNPGDVAALKPQNLPEYVEKLLTRLDWLKYADTSFELTINRPDGSNHFHSKCWTLRKLLTEELDCYSIPRKSFFEILAQFSHDEMFTERLNHFISPEGLDDFLDYNQRMKKTVLEVLEDFPGLKFPYEYAFDAFPLIKSRCFSISSCIKNRIELVVGIVNYKTKMKVPREGLCTRWLATLTQNTKVNLSIKKGSFTFSNGVLPTTPIILCCAGTGIAPMRSLIYYLLIHQDFKQEIYLFFGCRNKNKDDIFYKEFNELSNSYPNFTYFYAYSRDQPNKVYIQNILLQNQSLIWSLINHKKASVYISGNTSLPKEIKKSLLEIFTNNLKNDIIANQQIEQLINERKIQWEAW
ncbi:Flavodoxin/nitric oxide synthase domain-containing protein [Rozella allomycis CSF55]|uniref:Flavodoxin/nitric oxide synthase domain-containing protein n=1 Tax=Rozella allomycis (strain CSF55) TaxID=988480 RepID=A0A075B4C6_ROZAC|nr:Flavodoxin/nitric oxide synthase domain-containing protein [Rozella allomycis CSF55]|eukprot:EPZ36052.1 Flavodoxin/nitric oxide synthase domain-containing protein [Rozella allomycis CSF55]